MYNKEKKFRGSAVTTICYVLAALMLIYTCYQIGTTVHQINEYYSQYGMKASPLEYITYVTQSALAPLVNAIVLFMLAAIHKEVRKNNPANYLSDEDIIEAAEAKKTAKEAKQAEKGEKAAAKAADKADKNEIKAEAKAASKTSGEEPVVADFTAAEPEPEKTEKTETTEKPAPKKARKPAAKKTDAGAKDDSKPAKSGSAKKTSGRKSSGSTKKTQPKKEANEAKEEAGKNE